MPKHSKIRYKFHLIGGMIALALLPHINTAALAKDNIISIPGRVQLQTKNITIETRGGETHPFNVEVANTPYARRQGLMNRTSMHVDKGMLFQFDTPAHRSFWMKNTLIPLDIIFLKPDGTIHHIHHNAEPKSLERITSRGEVLHILEILGGQAAERNIKIGDMVHL